MDTFPLEDRSKNFKDINLCVDELPTQQSLRLYWDLETDSYMYKLSQVIKLLTKRGLLSTVNGKFDPLGIAAPVVVTGKLLLREITSGPYDMDYPLPTDMLN